MLEHIHLFVLKLRSMHQCFNTFLEFLVAQFPDDLIGFRVVEVDSLLSVV